MINKKMFQDEKSEKFKTDPGSRFQEKFHGVVNPDGTIDLVSDGFEDTQEIIESWQQETDIYNIIDRVTSGDIALLTERTGHYMDITSIPKTYPEMLQMIVNAQEDFNRLPAEVKQKFDNDLNKFIVSFGTADFYEKLGINLNKEVQVSQDTFEKKENE